MTGEDPVSGTLSLLAVAASMLLSWIFYRVRLLVEVRMRQCEMILLDIARALEDVRKTAEAIQTRQRVVKALTLTADKTLKEYNTFLSMLQQRQEGDFHRPDLPILRHQLEMETLRAQVSMVQGSLLAMSQEMLNLGAAPPKEHGQENVLKSLKNCGKSYMHMSEELLTLLDKHSIERAGDIQSE